MLPILDGEGVYETVSVTSRLSAPLEPPLDNGRLFVPYLDNSLRIADQTGGVNRGVPRQASRMAISPARVSSGQDTMETTSTGYGIRGTSGRKQPTPKDSERQR